MKRLIEKYTGASDRIKKLVSYALIGVIVTIIAISMWQGKKRAPVRKKETVKFEQVVPEISLLQKSLYQETKAKTRKLQTDLMELKAQLKKLQQQMEQQRERQNKMFEQKLNQLNEMIKKQNEMVSQLQKKRAEQVPRTHPEEKSPLKLQPEGKPPVKPQWVGGIEVKEREEEEKQKESKKEEKKKKKFTVYLPPSFVSADLLNGFAAFSSQKGEKEPVRALFRVKDLAVLPNEVKADLKGCFVIGEARGDLSDERAHVRLLRLSCISRDGSSVIDSAVKGWVVDEDGKAGLKGIVVTKMGAFLTRYMLAGFLQGFGEAYSSSQYYTTYSSTSGVVTLPSPGEAAKAGLGKGIAKAGKGLADFYLELAKQTLPVIEVGAGKKVTLVFTEGVELEIKKHCIKGRDGCRDSLSSLARLF